MQTKLTVKCECTKAAQSNITKQTFAFFDQEFAPRITQAEFDNHDCHLGSEDGCKPCAVWAEQQQADRRKVDERNGSAQLVTQCMKQPKDNVLFGRNGGLARAEKLSKERRSEIARNAALAMHTKRKLQN